MNITQNMNTIYVNINFIFFTPTDLSLKFYSNYYKILIIQIRISHFYIRVLEDAYLNTTRDPANDRFHVTGL